MGVPIEAMRVCKSHAVALEEVEWAYTGHEESACTVEAMKVSVKIM